MTTPIRLHFGIKTAQQHTTYEELLRVWREADSLPIFEHAWLFDHFQPIVADRTGPCLEGWTLLAALATRTQRLRVAVMVIGLTYRHPAVLANMAATVDVITRGRVGFGIGAVCWLLVTSVSQNRPVRTPHAVSCSLPIPQRKSTIESMHLLIFTKGKWTLCRGFSRSSRA